MRNTLAKSKEWATDMYCLFLHSVLPRKIKGVYCALSTAQCSDYGLVKEGTLEVYELVLEAYCQKFRNLVKQSGETHVEFAREKENAFDRWLSPMNADDYGKGKIDQRFPKFKKGPVCYHCKKFGRSMSDCLLLENRKSITDSEKSCGVDK